MNERVDIQDAEIGAALKILGDALQKVITSEGKKAHISLNEIGGTLERQLRRVHLMTEIGDLPRLIEALIDTSVAGTLGVSSILAMLRTKSIESTQGKA